MSIFDDREKGYEAKFGHDQEVAFKAKVLRNRMLGLWVAEHLGLDAAAAKTYATEMVEGELRHHGDDELIAKVVRDLTAKGVPIDTNRVRNELAHFAAAARKQLGIQS
ncbi:MAG TPA: DUF1476 domain-containing protein [Stellaceae bacterium]|nr:DUF1476 domain-containing protein [Stellaceae bacterium]